MTPSLRGSGSEQPREGRSTDWLAYEGDQPMLDDLPCSPSLRKRSWKRRLIRLYAWATFVLLLGGILGACLCIMIAPIFDVGFDVAGAFVGAAILGLVMWIAPDVVSA